MKRKKKLSSAADIQLDQLARELETEEGKRRLGEEAYKEALAAKKRKSIHNNSPKR